MNNLILRKQQQTQKQENKFSFYNAFLGFYFEDFQDTMKQFRRGKKLSMILLFIHFIQIHSLLFNDTI